MTDQGTRGSYAVGVERRERILDAATFRFAEFGYARTTLADIARDVGLTGPGLKHHFPSKQHLLLALAERRFDMAAMRALNNPGTSDGTGTLRVMLDIAQMYASHPELMRLFVLVSAEAADSSSGAHNLFTQYYERVIDEVTAMFEEEARAGALRAHVDYRSIAREAIAVADGLQLQWVLSGGVLPIVDLTRAHLERLSRDISYNGVQADLREHSTSD